MEKRAICISVVVAGISLFASKLLLKWHGALADYIYTETENFIYPFVTALAQPINSLSWFLPGMVVGFLCAKDPIKNGAATGALFGAALGLLGIALASSQTHEFASKVSQLSFAAILTIQYSVLFSVSAAFGHQINKRRAAL
ncbi:hypothetical protein ACPESN_06815 [Stutzerimonas marianensis]|uniref:hypothetical protein n=1 Tax=Stutzerimonas marianensis TaxID=2929513 RepID=UPI003C2C98C8